MCQTENVDMRKEEVKKEISEQEPTVYLQWVDGVLMQKWKVTDRHLTYWDGVYVSSSYHTREEWRKV